MIGLLWLISKDRFDKVYIICLLQDVVVYNAIQRYIDKISVITLFVLKGMNLKCKECHKCLAKMRPEISGNVWKILISKWLAGNYRGISQCTTMW